MEADGPKGSEWYLGPVDAEPGEELISVYQFQLLKLRPALLEVVTLPTGYMAVFDGDVLKAIVTDRVEEIQVDLR